MTPKERRHPLLVKQRSRKRRIIKGAGIKSDKEFDQFIKQFEKMQKMLKKFSGNKMQSMMSRLSGKMPGGLSSLGFPPFGDHSDK